MGDLRLSLFCYALRSVLSSFAIILKRKRESWLICFYCLVDVCLNPVHDLWLFLMVPWVGLWCVTVVFPDHTHVLSLIFILN